MSKEPGIKIAYLMKDFKYSQNKISFPTEIYCYKFLIINHNSYFSWKACFAVTVHLRCNNMLKICSYLHICQKK